MQCEELSCRDNDTCVSVGLVFYQIKKTEGKNPVAKKKIETRGRKTLGNGEPTVRTAVCLPEGLFNRLVELGDQSGLGYSHYIREACIAQYQPKRKKVSRRS